MKKILFTIICLFINIVVFAQTQYDYYEDDVAHSKPDLDWHAILGLIVLTIIGFIIWVINKDIKARKEYKEKQKREVSVQQAIRRNNIIKEGGIVCPICDTAIYNKQHTFSTRVFTTNSYDIICELYFCRRCEEESKKIKHDQKFYDHAKKCNALKEIKRFPK